MDRSRLHRYRFAGLFGETRALVVAGLFILLFFFSAASLLGQAVNVLTWRYDNTEQGQNTQETILTLSNVTTNTFGKLFSQTVDGNLFAQPLYVSNLTINGAVHNVLFLATEHDSVYAFDADSNGGSNSAPLWQASMISTLHGAAAGATTVPSSDVQSGTGDINPEIGITSTPVIDATTQTIFVVAKSKENGNYVQRLHALNILNGSERAGSPVVLSASVPGDGQGSSGGTLTFSSLWQNNRPALVLFNGNIYIGFGSHGDNGPWHGWVLVYNETSLQQTAAICTSPNGEGSGIWSSGAGFPIDTVSANGRAFLATGNGDLTTYPPLSNSVDFGESILRYDLSNNGFAISDAFTTFNQAALSGSDLDLGSGGILMLPDQPGPYPHLLVQIGKEGRIVVLNRDKLNGYVGSSAGSNTNAVQDITGALKTGQGLWSTPAYWNETVYLAAGGVLETFSLTNGVLSTSATSVTTGYGFPGASLSISSNGTQNGILWGVETDQYGSNGPAILHAYNAENLGQELYNSNQNPTRDDPGPANKFAVPVVTNGKVYVNTSGQINVFGLLNLDQQAPAPVISPAGGSYGTAQQITITDSVSGATIYYTTDGSTPTAVSTKYTGPFTLSTNAEVQAIASASGYLQSAVTTATYSFTSQTATPQFSPAAGTYSSAQSVTITDTTPNASIYYTTDGSTPTTSSARYSSPIQVSSNTIVNAIAAAAGLANSAVSSATYVIQLPGTSINFPDGFASVVGLTLNGSATNVDDSRLQLTTGVGGQAGSVFFNTPTNIQAFTTDFTFQLSNAQADGFTFAIQNVGVTALGGPGGSLGYGGMAKSIAVKFDFYNNAGEGTDSTGLYVNGASPTVPAVDMTSSGVLLNSGDTITAHITYDGTNLTMLLTDIVVNKMFTYTWPINIPSTVGSNVAYIGFTGASGGETASQKILSWTFSSQAPTNTATAPPTFSPAGGTYTSAQSVTLSDTTTGAVIYYTTDGSTPTTSSTVYKTAISVSSGTVTIHAIAQASGDTVSTMSSATYTIQPVTVTATPTISPASGTYTSAQSVTISDPGATIYYTTNGTTPTTSSTVYSAAIPVTANTTVEAIAVAAGSSASYVASASYVIQSGTPGAINFAAGFSGATGLQFNGTAKLNAANLEVTDGGAVEANSAYWTTPVNIQAFTTNFTFQLVNAQADGFTFTIQNTGLTAKGQAGGGLGYGAGPGATTGGIGNSVAVKFDIYSNSGEGSDSTGVYTDGASPTVPAVSLTSSGITLASGDTIAAQLVYNGTTLTLSLTDTVTNKTFTQAFTVNIPSTVGANTAYVGFTGGTGGQSMITNIESWTFSSTATPTAAEPAFSPLPGTYTTSQNVILSSATPNATIYYTVDGSTPTHSSATYSAPIVVSGVSLTIRAFASATSYLDSPIVVGTYQIQPATVATPSISPASGTTFPSSLSVSITDSTANAAIYYTTDGSTPTTSSTKYSGAFSVTSTTVVKAMATASGMTNSSVATASYTLVPVVTAPPTFSPAGGTYTSAQSVTLSDTTTGAVIYYTTDGSTPTTSSAVYKTAISVSSGTVTIHAIAQASGDTVSTMSTATYTIQPVTVTATPTISPASGTYTSAQSVTISDPGATIYYTTNGTTPTTSSTVYSAAIPVTANTTIEAIAVAAGSSASNVASASYVIQPVTVTATPTISPASGTYTSAQSVTISDPGATIYYTTNGTTPTTSSTVYSAAIPVTANTTVEAIAVAAGSTASNVASATYVIQSGTPGSINFAAGFSGATGLQFNGTAKLNAANLEVTDGGAVEANSAYWTTPVNIQAFTTNFTFQLVNAQADGFTFTIQNAGLTAKGQAGGGLGYGAGPGATTGGIGNSVAVKFDLYNNSGEGTDSTGVYTDGASPTVPAVSLTSSGITLASGDTIAAQLVYNGTTLTLSLTDTVTNKTFTQAFTVNIPSTVGANTAYVGFTGGTGGASAIQNIKSWTYTVGTP